MSFVTTSANSAKDDKINYIAVDTSPTDYPIAFDDKAVSHIDGWPQGPQPLTGISILKFLGDALLVLLPIPFLALAIEVLQLSNEPLSDHGKMIQRLIALGPTLYPLVYAAVCGRYLRSFAIWLAERGTTLETLEKLLRSQSFVSAIGTAITLRSINTISIPLLLIWFMSPLGGQSSLRMLSEKNATIPDTGTVYYAHPEAPFNLDRNQSWFSVVPTALLASLAASRESREGPIDLWKHPKVPRLDKIETESWQADPEGEWIPVGSERNYSSLLGINVQGLKDQTRSRMDVNHTYMTVDCHLRHRDDATQILRNLTSSARCTRPMLPMTNTTIFNGTRADNNVKAGNILRNTTVYFQDQAMTKTNEFMFKYGFSLNGTNNGTRCEPNDDENILERVYFLYGQQSFTTDLMHVYECKPRFYTVNARLDCRSDTCIVDRLRRVANKWTQSPATECKPGSFIGDVVIDDNRRWRQLPCLATAPTLLDDFVNNFVMATTSYPAPLNGTNKYSIFDDFILGGNETYPTNPEGRDLDLVSDHLMSQRLTLIMNAFWQAASWGPLTTRMDPYNKPKAEELKAEFRFTSQMKPKGEIMNTTATIEWTIPVYHANVAWCMTLLFTTGILISFGVLNLGMSCYTIAPDLFSYAASMTRGNPYTNVPGGGTALGGTERSRLLKKLKVQIADVRPGDEVGYVALRSVDRRSEFDRGRLKKGRKYE
ncbi:hypothetical protein FB567DRAFT_469954 [Paraphoma chrysanthemicola]|uniref:Uncharacterized protein n=1 Tax=Paraphoma chrysanthemicola TaxID=798071 RepID=A0A8K0VZ49_9PLEO|nr:hypothetical protein FB567DRAFT_469954 [Paraphoma chrysanthemicola]